MHVESDIRSYFAENVLFDEFTYDDSASLLEEGVVDSVAIMGIVTFIEEKYDIVVDDADLVPENFDSVTNIADYIRAKRG